MGSLVLASAVALLVLFVPGFLFLRTARFSRVVSVTAAPIVGVFAYAALPILYRALGVSCDFVSVFVVTFAVSLAARVASQLVSRGEGEEIGLAKSAPLAVGRLEVPFEWVMLAVYVLVGAIVCWFMLVSNLATADAIYCRWDNQTHLNLARAFLDSGEWSSLQASLYAGAPENAIPVYKSSSFYPSAWSDVVALVCSATGLSVPVSANGVNIVLTGLVFPASMFLLVSALFPRERSVVAAGSFVAMAFAAFPWGFFVKGPLYPNLVSYLLMVAALAIVVMTVEGGLTIGRSVRLALVGFVAAVAIALSQPNALFAAFVFLVAFACHLAWKGLRAGGKERGTAHPLAGVAAIAGILALACGIWAACFNAPFMQSVVGYRATIEVTVPEAASRVVTLWMGSNSTGASCPEYVLAAVAAVGYVVCMARKKVWLVFPALCVAAFYIASQSEIDFVRQFFSGFWYSDAIRLAACYGLFLTPVAAAGMAFLAALPVKAYRLARHDTGAYSRAQNLCRIAVGLILAAGLFAPVLPTVSGKLEKSGMARAEERMNACYDKPTGAVFDKSERKFVKEACSVVPEGALVLNQPHDGSSFAYGCFGLNTYFRKAAHLDEKPEGTLIAARLAGYATDPEVQEAVRSTGAEYVLLLDQGVGYADGKWMPQCTKAGFNSWSGLNAINDDTPGFTIVLADGDRRLYRIDELAA